jgi:hypothetical protein
VEVKAAEEVRGLTGIPVEAAVVLLVFLVTAVMALWELHTMKLLDQAAAVVAALAQTH